MFKIDRICRDHDIRYTKAQTQKDLKEADWIMMKEILDKYDDNNDGFIDAEEAKDTGLSQEEIDRINSQKQSIIDNNYLSSYKKRKMLGKL